MSDVAAKYEALRLLLAGAATADRIDLSAVLDAVCQAVGLAGAAVVLAPYEGEPEALAGSDWARAALRDYVAQMWGQLARDHRVESAYLQLAPEEGPRSLFAYPLRAGTGVIGAVVGLAEGHRNLSLEEDFLLALATAMRLTRSASGPDAASPWAPGGELSEAVEKARLAAILETAIAVNHEVNNPLTAVLGNTQLLLLQSDRLDAQLKKRLEDIERSALRIKEVTQKLLKQDGRKTTEYPGGQKMLDLSDTDTPEEPPEPA